MCVIAHQRSGDEHMYYEPMESESGRYLMVPLTEGAILSALSAATTFRRWVPELSRASPFRSLAGRLLGEKQYRDRTIAGYVTHYRHI